jgi:hypothetical protein
MVVVAIATKKQRTRYIQLQQGEHEVSAPTADCRWSVVIKDVVAVAVVVVAL